MNLGRHLFVLNEGPDDGFAIGLHAGGRGYQVNVGLDLTAWANRDRFGLEGALLELKPWVRFLTWSLEQWELEL